MTGPTIRLWCALLLIPALGGAADDGTARESVYGLWLSEESLLRVAPNGAGLSMVVVALKEPRYLPDEEAGVPGAARRDDNNQEESLRGRPVLGLELLSGYRFDGRRWQGRIYDPKSGNTYSSRMQRDGERLEMRGYIGVPMLGRTQFFEPVRGCDERALAMIEASEADVGHCD